MVVNDPITGQGSNTASKAAKVYMDRILENGNKPFDAAWMQQTFDELLELRAMGGEVDQHFADSSASAHSAS